MKAILFDCDGVLVDTERDGHRVAFNRAFKAMGIDIEWDVPLYGGLLKTAGGKERMRRYFDKYGWPAGFDDRAVLIKELHDVKTGIFMEIIAGGELPLRSGVSRLVDEAAADGIKLAVCSTSNERSVRMIVDKLLGGERGGKFSGIFAGDMVVRKKPDPSIYLLAKEKLGVDETECVVVEDSRNGLLAAKAAGMRCVITKSAYTEMEDFTEADYVVEELGDAPAINMTLQDMRRLREV